MSEKEKFKEAVRRGLQKADKILREMSQEDRDFMPCSEWDIVEESILVELAAEPVQEQTFNAGQWFLGLQFLKFSREAVIEYLNAAYAAGQSTNKTQTKEKPAPTPDWDRDTGNGFNKRGYPAGFGIYHDPMG